MQSLRRLRQEAHKFKASLGYHGDQAFKETEKSVHNVYTAVRVTHGLGYGSLVKFS